MLQKFKVEDNSQQTYIFEAEKRLTLDLRYKTESASSFDYDEYDKLLLSYVVGESFLPREDIGLLHRILNPLFGEQKECRSSSVLLKMLCNIGYLRPKDNPYRKKLENKLKLGPRAESLALKCKNVADPFASLRTIVQENVYAIDSQSTFEVDDAVSVRIENDGRKRVTVYVAAVTSYCPLDSSMDRHSGQRLRTTTYLPEGVWCMLPRTLVAAATLESGRSCRTFHISFVFDIEGNVCDYDTGVSIVENLRRLTYDDCQDILQNKRLPSSAPDWLTSNDVDNILCLNEIRKLRRALRIKNGAWKLLVPKPRVKAIGVEDNSPIHVKLESDESLHLSDAYNLVEELMIAANEVCARVALENNIGIPFRVTRPLSERHGDADELLPGGSSKQSFTPSVEQGMVRTAQVIAQDSLSLKGVTRAYYSHQRGHHSFLNSSYYCHSTSPLRRYADMMVHHQLKTLLAARHELHDTGVVCMEDLVLKDQCRKTSAVTSDVRLLQNSSIYFWALSYIENLLKKEEKLELTAIVAMNINIESSPTMQYANTRYVARVLLQKFLIVVCLYHNEDKLAPGDAIQVVAKSVDPIQLSLLLQLAPNWKRETRQLDLVQLTSVLTCEDI